eukprot:m.272618 g.272618  ORF g.272618 m.272618 type:complete len:398 (-) comp102467_c0_seq1:505-1698(-)
MRILKDIPQSNTDSLSETTSAAFDTPVQIVKTDPPPQADKDVWDISRAQHEGTLSISGKQTMVFVIGWFVMTVSGVPIRYLGQYGAMLNHVVYLIMVTVGDVDIDAFIKDRPRLGLALAFSYATMPITTYFTRFAEFRVDTAIMWTFAVWPLGVLTLLNFIQNILHHLYSRSDSTTRLLSSSTTLNVPRKTSTSSMASQSPEWSSTSSVGSSSKTTSSSWRTTYTGKLEHTTMMAVLLLLVSTTYTFGHFFMYSSFGEPLQQYQRFPPNVLLPNALVYAGCAIGIATVLARGMLIQEDTNKVLIQSVAIMEPSYAAAWIAIGAVQASSSPQTQLAAGNRYRSWDCVVLVLPPRILVSHVLFWSNLRIFGSKCKDHHCQSSRKVVRPECAWRTVHHDF